MSHFQTVLVYVSRYGEKNTDIEIEVQLYGSPADIERGKKAVAEAIENHFTARAGKPQPKIKYNLAVEESGKDKTKRRGYKGLFAGSGQRDRPITDLQSRVARKLDEAYQLSPRIRKRPSKKRKLG